MIKQVSTRRSLKHILKSYKKTSQNLAHEIFITVE